MPDALRYELWETVRRTISPLNLGVTTNSFTRVLRGIPFIV
jgi:hypothetical protein